MFYLEKDYFVMKRKGRTTKLHITELEQVNIKTQKKYHKVFFFILYILLLFIVIFLSVEIEIYQTVAYIAILYFFMFYGLRVRQDYLVVKAKGHLRKFKINYQNVNSVIVLIEKRQLANYEKHTSPDIRP
jgi:uncharacterized membrane protein